MFISHSRKDKPAARTLVGFIMDFGLDVHFDEFDEALQLADEVGDDGKVVSCIEDGILNSSLLLGLITENTKDSWWVPYEIGSATGHGKVHAHLVASSVTHLPSYIKASTILPSIADLGDWLPSQAKVGSASNSIFLELVERTTAKSSHGELRTSFSSARAMDDLKFY